MRPINKGPNPVNEYGELIVFTKYSRSRRYLIDRIGEYCSYCERKIEASLAVEHVKPKASNPDLALEWSNFLLGCTNCNSTKGKKEVILGNFVWPDSDNTFDYFKYDDSGIVNVPDHICEPVLIGQIQNMLDLVGLQKHPPKQGTVSWEEASDRRFEHRIEAWDSANRYMNLYKGSITEIRVQMVPLIKDLVVHQGFWSIWMNVFYEFSEVQVELVNSMSGTNKDHFQYLFPYG